MFHDDNSGLRYAIRILRRMVSDQDRQVQFPTSTKTVHLSGESVGSTRERRHLQFACKRSSTLRVTIFLRDQQMVVNQEGHLKRWFTIDVKDWK